MNLGLRLTGIHTAAFRCGCLFARGDVAGVAAWRLCPEHADRQPMIEQLFGGDAEPCLIIHRKAARVRSQLVGDLAGGSARSLLRGEPFSHRVLDEAPPVEADRRSPTTGAAGLSTSGTARRWCPS